VGAGLTGDPIRRLDDLTHRRVRLGILVILDGAAAVEFTYLRRELGLTAGNLSRHLAALGSAGFLEIEKEFAGRRPRTLVRITPEGRSALAREIEALAELVDRVRARAARGPWRPLPTSDG